MRLFPLVILLLLSACAFRPSADGMHEAAADKLFLSGLDELAANGQSSQLAEFVQHHPDHRYAATATRLLEADQKQRRRQEELLKSNLNQESQLKQLRSDLDRLRKLLIEAEQRAP